MPSSFTAVETLDVDSHHFRIFEPSAGDGWLNELASEYKKLRTETRFPLEAVKFDGITVLSTAQLKARLEKACIPPYVGGSLDIIRSDLGETISQVILEKDYLATFGYKSLRDRELIQLPGRGIDAVGIEDEGDSLTLVLGETKTSDEKRCPPKVVDTNPDCLSKQHKHHLKELGETTDKLWNISRFCPTRELQALFMRAFYLFEAKQWDKLKLVLACVLVRSKERYKEKDFGSLRKSPAAVTPATIRFIIARTPEDLEATAKKWHDALTGIAHE